MTENLDFENVGPETEEVSIEELDAALVLVREKEKDHGEERNKRTPKQG